MPTNEFRRRLTAILSADVEGYSRLMRDNEEATIRTLTTYRDAMTNLIQQYRGRVVDSPGDNLLAEFGSVVDAVSCADIVVFRGLQFSPDTEIGQIGHLWMDTNQRGRVGAPLIASLKK